MMNYQGTKTQRQPIRIKRSPNRAGMTLLELLGCAAILAVVINLAAQVFITSSRLSVLGTTSLDRAGVVEDIRDEFVAAVRQSSAIRSSVGNYRSDSEQLILALSPSARGGNAKRYTVFGYIGSESRLSKLVISEKDGAYAAERFVTYPVDLESVRFTYGRSVPQKARLVSLELRVKNEGSRREADVAHTFTAAMRGVSK
jgi:hypothetical protein